MFSIILLTLMLAEAGQDKIPVEISVDVYPKELHVGDTFYLHLFVKNIDKTTIEQFPEVLNVIPNYNLQFNVVLENVSQPLYDEDASGITRDILFEAKALTPGENRLVYQQLLQFPPLEDLHLSAWENFIKDLPPEGQKVKLETVFIFENRTIDPFVRKGQMISTEIVIKPRPKKEMALIEKWYQDTSEKFFPRLILSDNEASPSHKKSITRLLAGLAKPGVGNDYIFAKGIKYSPWNFVRTSNRYPVSPNAPETWQGWQELEESL